jgi:hypothetical protein
MNIDSLVLDQSLATTPDNIEFVGKKWVYCNDSNSGSYSGGTILIDSTQITNSGAFNNSSEGFLLIPLVIQLTSATAANLPANTFLADNLWALKDGFQMINSMSVEYNGTNVVQESPYINIYNSFKAKTTWSWNDVFNDGPSSIFFPDNASSWQYASASSNASNLSSGGVGLQNNRDAPTSVTYTGVATADITTATPSYGASPVAGIPTAGVYAGIPAQNSFIGCPTSYNDGFSMRKYYTNYDPNDSSTLNQVAINNASSCLANFRNYKPANATQGSVIWMAYLKLRLKDLGDFFQQIPLVKGGTFRIRLTTNQCITNFTTVKATFAGSGAIATYPTLVVNSTTVTGGLTCPLQIASAGLGQGSSALAADTYNLSVSIYKNNNSTQTTVQNSSNALSSIRLYVPCYTFNPIVESNYITMNSQRKILYNDVFQYQYTGIGAGGSFNFLVSNGIPNIQTVVVVPLISQANSNGTAGTIGTLISPCCNTGASPDPLQITNFQIQISGQNLFMENEYYDFQQFMEELRSVNQLNGSITTGLTSGLINEFQFSRGMRYYVGNASRILPSERGVTRSVNITGLNSSLLTMDIFVFVVFQKQITINCATGQVISM